MKKIKRKILAFGYWLLVIGLLFYTRFVGLNWGLPYPMHPDERNMAVAVQRLNCEISNLEFRVLNFKECFNPHFFAYGQLPLYLAYFLIWVWRGFYDVGRMIISYDEAIMALRIISAFSSIFSALIMIKILKIITNKKKENFWWLLIIIFSPFFIQFSHFGTTEALLMFFYLLLIYFCLLILKENIAIKRFIFLASLVSGLSLATKVSSLVYFFLPILTIFLIKDKNIYQKIFFIGYFLGEALVFFLIFSPHNIISWSEFISALRYESAVALGKMPVFYTKQFDYSLPIVFQLIKVIPAALGMIGFIGLIGLIRFIGKRERKIIFLVLAFFLYFLPNALIYVKWTRFLAPIFPLILIFGILFLESLKIKKVIRIIIIIFAILPGIGYLSIYQNSDVRFEASEWIFKNIRQSSYILSETANVVDLPIIPPKLRNLNLNQIINRNYQIFSFNFYDLDQNKSLQKELAHHLNKAEYIIVPSRRIFANYTCFWPEKKDDLFLRLTYDKSRCEDLKKRFPYLNRYYQDLFSGRLGFEKVVEFSSYPKISFFGKTLLEFPDEQAEETWTVFDHPVIRVYKRVKRW